MVVLPAALVWAEERSAFRWSDLDPRYLFRASRYALSDATADMSFGLRRPRAQPARSVRGRRRLPRPGLPRPRLPRPRLRRRRA
jgi:hypothetical protein